MFERSIEQAFGYIPRKMLEIMGYGLRTGSFLREKKIHLILRTLQRILIQRQSELKKR